MIYCNKITFSKADIFIGNESLEIFNWWGTANLQDKKQNSVHFENNIVYMNIQPSSPTQLDHPSMASSRSTWKETVSPARCSGPYYQESLPTGLVRWSHEPFTQPEAARQGSMKLLWRHLASTPAGPRCLLQCHEQLNTSLNRYPLCLILCATSHMISQLYHSSKSNCSPPEISEMWFIMGWTSLCHPTISVFIHNWTPDGRGFIPVEWFSDTGTKPLKC